MSFILRELKCNYLGSLLTQWFGMKRGNDPAQIPSPANTSSEESDELWAVN